MKTAGFLMVSVFLAGCMMGQRGTVPPQGTEAPMGLQACAVTCVFVNGQELNPPQLAELQSLVGPVAPGRYWLDANGNAGPEGGPATVNLVYLQQQRAQAQGAGYGSNGNGSAYGNGGDNFWSSGASNSAGNEAGGAGYVCVEGSCATYGM